jgi:hypothetical protein
MNSGERSLADENTKDTKTQAELETETEAENRLWRQRQYFRSVLGDGGTGRVVDYSKLRRLLTWR